MDDSVEKLKRLHQELNMLYELHPSIYGQHPYDYRYLVRDVLDQDFMRETGMSIRTAVIGRNRKCWRDGLRPEMEQ